LPYTVSRPQSILCAGVGGFYPVRHVFKLV
jgi:hypothetical protein